MKKEELNTKNKKKKNADEEVKSKKENVIEEKNELSNNSKNIKNTKKEIELEKEKKVDDKEPAKKSRIMDFLLVGGLVLVIALGAFLMKDNSEKITYELPLTLTGDVGLHQLTYDEYQEKIDNKEEL